MGVDFFRKTVELQKKYGRPGSVVANGLQTNGTLINDEMARLFSEFHFLLGVSLDGPPEFHDHYRLYGNGKPSHENVMRGIGKLQNHNVDFNILVLVNDLVGANPKTVYHYLTDKGFLYHQYIPCVEFDRDGTPLPFSVDGSRWGDFLCTLYDEWYAGDTRRVSIRLFDSILSYLVDNTRTICHMGKNCCQYFVVEYNGDIFPCDFFVDKSLRIGNIMTTDWNTAQTADVYRSFGMRKSGWHEACETCPWLEYCAGDCLKHRYGNPAYSKIPSHLCKGWKRFFAHALPGFKKLAEKVKEERRIAQMRNHLPHGGIPSTEIGRNDPCPCGSGLKYKKCCMR